MKTTKAERQSWANWLAGYGGQKFATALARNVQGAKSRCTQCKQDIYLDFFEGGGVGDWKTRDGDYGCDESPETTAEGCGGHMPERL